MTRRDIRIRCGQPGPGKEEAEQKNGHCSLSFPTNAPSDHLEGTVAARGASAMGKHRIKVASGHMTLKVCFHYTPLPPNSLLLAGHTV